MTGNVAFGGADVTAHQQLGQFAVAIGNGIENPVVLGERLVRAVGRGGKLDAVHAHQLVQLAAEHLREGAVARALDDPVVEIEIAFLLVVADPGLERRVALVGIEHPAQLVDFLVGHALGGQAAGHAFQGLADFIKLDQLGMAQGHHPRPDMGHPHQQALAFQAVDRLAQRAAADAVGACQFWLGNLAARGDLALDDGRLNAPEDVFGQGFRIVLRHGGGIELIQHIVDTFKINATKTSQYKPTSQRKNIYCRQSSNNPLHQTGTKAPAPPLAP
ncbi:hypothetical protein EMIT0196P_70295 [Pseudomonas chlororaphis]